MLIFNQKAYDYLVSKVERAATGANIHTVRAHLSTVLNDTLTIIRRRNGNYGETDIQEARAREALRKLGEYDQIKFLILEDL